MVTQSAKPVPADARRSLRVYNSLFPIVFVFLLPGVVRRMLRRGNFQDNFAQRFARYSAAVLARFALGSWTWIHSISVGETLIALKLARELHQNDPNLQVALSVTTTTGFALAHQTREPWLQVIYNPLDLLSITRRALDTIRPQRLFFIEGEAWPNLLAECCQRGIPTALVNARLSPRSEGRFRRFQQWTGPIFRLLDLICVPEVEDIARWKSLGVDPLRVRHTGSIKFDLCAATAGSRVAEFQALLLPLGVTAQTPILVAGSTWAPEERALMELLVELRREIPDLFLIVVPRHVERSAEILRELREIRTCRRSALPLSAPQSCDLLLVDTTGELRDWYELASVVFVGKSLPGIAEIGGQNPAEPAALGKPVVFGPHMENFQAVVELLLSHEAALQVDNPAGLTREMRALLSSPSRCQLLSARAQTALALHQHSTRRAATLLGTLA